ncbi:hypothetical protein H4R35_003678 [Dimargaris xerosporica]|nr:hypothetical protein H4R35_003678 [Dimargaris xerosporica]
MADNLPNAHPLPQPTEPADRLHRNAATLAPLIATRLVSSMRQLEMQLDTIAQRQHDIHQRLLQLFHNRSVSEYRLDPFIKTLEKVPQYHDKICQYRQRMVLASSKANGIKQRASQLRLFKAAKDQEREQFISQQQLLDQAIEARMAPSVQAATLHPSTSALLSADTQQPSHVDLTTGSSGPTPDSTTSAATFQPTGSIALSDTPIVQSPQLGQGLQIKRLARKKKGARRPLIE